MPIFCLVISLNKSLNKSSPIVIPFSSFKGTTYAYLLKISVTHNKNLVPSLNLPINWISAKSAHQILSLNEEQTLIF